MTVLIAAGVLVCLLSAAGALRARTVLDRLHLLTPVTSVGTPLIAIGLAVHAGWHLATALLLLCAAVMLPAGPVLASATGHAAREATDHAARETTQQRTTTYVRDGPG
ncbi:monovalent cation/H(+) antiporter subunit G [Actinoplanes sp. KI2]|uniref:monovalent cation/H(+) antiporter subunit G n=1 Tax=Actinoplanes sp. KI2 TaxID=2983315 RepID=UPI0021D5FF01|nr:monovalent cation/H(+) antiporter subunit G [Actinoplanes sp. KI2]MCU7726266.1 monovalent cation/H(+) antiporter subunit G [Actinoplanes sp. KI2]